MKRFNNAFTLTELLVALGVVAILCAILMPVIFNLIPNQSLAFLEYRFYDREGTEIDLKEEIEIK